MAWSIEKMLKENADKIPESDKGPIQAAIDRVKREKDGTDVDAIKRAVSDLQNAAQAMAQHVHRAPGGPDGQQGAGPSAGGGGKDDVIDAEFEVKK
jgi:molecular chaperone DnaK